ncbi:MAG: type II secretion system F family protein [Nitrospirota bacterium]|jgi:type IV pilus assembly protein PilC
MAEMVFQWAGKTPQGTIESGEMTAKSKDEVQALLRRRKITPTTITEKQKKSFWSLQLGDKKITDKDIVVFTRQFSVMIDAGLPLVQALEILSTQVENKSLGKVLAAIKEDVEGGSTYADALRKHPRTFTELYANMVAAGESGGILDTILQRLAAYMEKAMKLKKKVKGALVYPATITVVAVIVVAVILVFVVPTFTEMFETLGGTLPVPTKIVVGISDFMKSTWWMILIALVGLVIFLRQFRRTPKGQRMTDGLFLKLPIFGELLNKVAISKFTRTMGTLTSSGVPILEGLEITAKTSGNKVVELAIMDVRQAVSEGKTLAEPLAKAKVFPPMVTHMIAVGESTGALDSMLTKIADFYDDEVDNTVNNLTAMMEPMLMVFLGTTVGFIIVAMYLPIFRMMTLIK